MAGPITGSEHIHQMNLRAVLFDYGMVLSRPACPVAHQELISLFGMDAAIFERFYWANRHDYDAGRFDGESYWHKVASDAGTVLTPPTVAKLIQSDVRMWSDTDASMLAWARSVGSDGIRTGILSNMCAELLVVLEKTRSWFHEFRYSTWSCRVGAAKPEPAIYQAALAKLEVQPDQVLFLDDKLENIRAAEEFGIRGIVFENLSRLRTDLETLGLAKFLPPIAADPMPEGSLVR
jgi:putative hydrolase of the HAD superfamily